jgi:adenylylsulfate kinase
VVLVAAISPYRAARDAVRRTIGNFIEVHVDAPLAICEQRDPKGLYRRARRGEVTDVSGIDAPYEAPLQAEVTCSTAQETVDESVRRVLVAIEARMDVRSAVTR